MLIVIFSSNNSKTGSSKNFIKIEYNTLVINKLEGKVEIKK